MALVGLYAGIGGFELGFQAAGYNPLLLADSDEHCQTLLKARFKRVRVEGDVGAIDALPDNTQIVTAGFPCQNLSMAGDKTGIHGQKSGDVRHMFELLEQGQRPTLAIENVYFMLHVQRGAAMSELIRMIEALDYSWAYRVVNTLAFGLPQRRRRVLLIASKDIDPRQVLFADEVGPPSAVPATLARPIGFYWTEGRTGVGTTVDGVPPLKIASTVGIPSMPAVLFPDGEVLTPGIEACERLQGFSPGWTDIEFGVRRSPRWRMIGNAVSVPAATWLAKRVRTPGEVLHLPVRALKSGTPWPTAAFGSKDGWFAVDASEFPVRIPPPSIEAYRDDSWKPLSARALSGFIARAEKGGLRFPADFLDALRVARDAAADEAALKGAS
jgi:DNA (cytosine-5)-methyltransferase 1